MEQYKPIPRPFLPPNKTYKVPTHQWAFTTFLYGIHIKAIMYATALNNLTAERGISNLCKIFIRASRLLSTITDKKSFYHSEIKQSYYHPQR